MEDAARSLVGGLSEAQLHQALLHPTAPSDIISGNRARMATPASMIHMNDAELWGSLLDDSRMRAAGRGDRPERRSGIRILRRTITTGSPSGSAPSGLAAADMTPDQRETLYALVDAYESRAPEGVLSRTPESLDGVHFGWAGPRTAGDPHYYRIHGPDLLVEYDNTQRDANHAHSVWRRPDSDFGFDALAAHRSNHPH